MADPPVCSTLLLLCTPEWFVLLEAEDSNSRICDPGRVGVGRMRVVVRGRTNGERSRGMVLSILVTLAFVATLLFMLVRAFTGPLRHRHGRPVH